MKDRHFEHAVPPPPDHLAQRSLRLCVKEHLHALSLLNCALLAFFLPLLSHAQTNRAKDLVNPFIGTGGHGHTFPGACVPNGLVQLSPDTRLDGYRDWDGCGGYHYSDSVIHGFSHTHLSGTGVADLCDVLLTPLSGTVNDPWLQAARGHRFSHSSERAHAGYYAVKLMGSTKVADTIGVELTATQRSGVHRYGFPSGKEARLVLDLRPRDQLNGSSITKVSPTEIVGERRSSSWARDQRLFFCIRFSRPILGEDPVPSDLVGKAASYRFGELDAPLIVAVGISAVSVEGARKNVEAEVPGWKFDVIRSAAENAWNAKLDKISLRGGTREQQRIFYTALYHCYVAPYIFNDVDGNYRGMDGQVHHADHNVYTVFSLWDTFRALHPLMTILEPDMTRDWIKTFLLHYQQGGRLPVWELWGNETDCMIGYHSVSVIADAYAKGIGGFDTQLALEAMQASANRDEPGLNAYRTKGYISSEDQSESVSKTLEYAYDDRCIALFAHALKQNLVKREYNRRARSWMNLFDPETRFFRARRNGGFPNGFDPFEVNFNYTEANAWQYSLFVPHDVEALEGAHKTNGGDLEHFIDSLFEASTATTGREQADMTGLIGQYVHGNEPSHHIAYLIEEGDERAAMVRRILNEQYHDAPDGLSGNEDCGQMSAWYVMSALGFYQVSPGWPEYTIGHPLFNEAAIELINGKRFVVSVSDSTWKEMEEAHAARERAQAARSKKPLPPPKADAHGRGWVFESESHFDHSLITAGGHLQFDRERVRKPEWKFDPEESEEEEEAEHRTSYVPIIQADSRTFADSLHITIRSALPKATTVVIASAAGTTPPSNELSFWIHSSCSVTASMKGEHPVTASFVKMDNTKKIQLGSTYAKQYAASGDRALVDGIRGGPDFRTGEWQGYQGQDVLATIDLGSEKRLGRVGLGMLQDMGSWIWYPEYVDIAWSTTGRTWRSVQLKPGLARDAAGGQTMDLWSERIGKKARLIKIMAKNAGPCPDWHPGKGGASWIFLDEVLVETE